MGRGKMSKIYLSAPSSPQQSPVRRQVPPRRERQASPRREIRISPHHGRQVSPRRAWSANSRANANNSDRYDRQVSLCGCVDCANDKAEYDTKPRMNRRGAVFYQGSDAAAEYIRHRGDMNMVCTDYYPHCPFSDLPEVPHCNAMNRPVSTRWTQRRGSVQSVTPTSCFRATMNVSSISGINVEMQSTHIKDSLAKVHNWDFNMFTFRRVTEGRPLFHLGFHLLESHDLFNKMNLDSAIVTKFLVRVEEAYHPENYYHNSTHAADVTQAIHCLISESKLYAHLTPMELLATMIAAMCHDLDHPGVTQDFLLHEKSESVLKVIHGRHSLLERHHCLEARGLIKDTGLLNHLEPEERKEILTLMEELILATDVTNHKEFMNEFEAMISSNTKVDFSDKERRRFLLKIAIKAADISNPARKLCISKYWSENIMEEFFRQGDYERAMKLNVSKLCDRNATTIPQSQSDFFSYVALPLFKAWSKLYCSNFSLYLCKNITTNKAYWDRLTAESEAMNKTNENQSHSTSNGENEGLRAPSSLTCI